MGRFTRASMGWTLIAALATGVGGFFAGSRAEARPEYMKEFKAAYKDKLEKMDCTICHPKENNAKKKIRNTFGMAVGECLGKEKVKDVDEIKKAIAGAVKKDSEVSGKTFEDLINDGKSPASKE